MASTASRQLTAVDDKVGPASSAPDSPLVDKVEVDRLLHSAAVLVVLKRALESRCALLEVASSAEEAEALRLRLHFDLMLVDIRLPGLSGLEWLRQLRDRGVLTHVIYMTAFADLDMAIQALRNGADDFVMKPFRIDQMLHSMQRTEEQRGRRREQRCNPADVGDRSTRCTHPIHSVDSR